jgi:hypothetical protein
VKPREEISGRKSKGWLEEGRQRKSNSGRNEKSDMESEGRFSLRMKKSKKEEVKMRERPSGGR